LVQGNRLDVLKNTVADILQRHVNAAVEEITAVMADEVEARAQDIVSDLRTQPAKYLEDVEEAVKGELGE
jgi:hypothetical protein